MRVITPDLRKLIKEDATFRKSFVIASRHNLPGLYPDPVTGRVWYADKDQVFLSVMNPCAVHCIQKLIEVVGVPLDERDREYSQPPYIVMRAEQYRSIDTLCQKADPRSHVLYANRALDIKEVIDGFDEAYIRQFIAKKLNNQTVFDNIDMTAKLVFMMCPDEE